MQWMQCGVKGGVMGQGAKIWSHFAGGGVG